MSGFPENVIEAVQASLATHFTVEDGYTVLTRPVRFEDPDKTITVFANEWVPQQEASAQIGQREPALATYTFRIQNYRKVANREVGRELAAIDAKIMRGILYRDANLALALGALTETLLGSRETFKRMGLSRTRYLNNDVNRIFVCLNTTDMWVETETVQL